MIKPDCVESVVSPAVGFFFGRKGQSYGRGEAAQQERA
jgi:hypothetical protein